MFVNSKTNEKVLAIRGTETDGLFGVFGAQTIADGYVADLSDIGGIGLALHQAVSLLNYVLRLKGSFNASIPQYVLRITPAGSGGAAPPLGLPFVTLPGGPSTYIWLEAGTSRGGLGLLAPSDKVTVTGHSLGGHLAALALRLFPTLFDQAVTFNAPGFDPFTSSQATSMVVALFANFLPQTEQPAKDFASLAPRLYSLESESSVPGNDENLIPGWPTNAQTFPNRVQIRTEVNSHSMDQLMDNLALHSLLEDIGGTIDAAKIFAIYDAASRDANDSSERLVAALNKIALGVDPNLATVAAGNFGYDATDFPNRAAMHTAILAIQAKLAPGGVSAGYKLTSLVEMSPDEIVANAQGLGIAYRYALRAGNPFVITGNDLIYTALNASGELDAANNSREYINDRVGYLKALFTRNISDKVLGNSVDGSEAQGVRYFDATTSTEIVTNPVPNNLSHTRNVIFGTPGADVGNSIASSGLPDTIYGDLGNDVLVGGAGSDYLEGGKDNDTLYGGAQSAASEDNARDMLVGGDGNDTYYAGSTDIIVDTAGNDTVFLANNGQPLKLNGTYRETGDSSGNYERQDGSSTITISWRGVGGVGDAEIRITNKTGLGGASVTLKDYSSSRFNVDLQPFQSTTQNAPGTLLLVPEAYYQHLSDVDILAVANAVAPPEKWQSALDSSTGRFAQNDVIKINRKPASGYAPDVSYYASVEGGYYADARYNPSGFGIKGVLLEAVDGGNDTLLGGEGADWLSSLPTVAYAPWESNVSAD